MRNMVIALTLVLGLGAATRGGENGKLPAELKGAASNTWVVLDSEKKDGRLSVLLFWAPEVGRVVRAGGATARSKVPYGGHHTREFDIAGGKWSDAKGGDFPVGRRNLHNMRAYVPSEKKFYVRARAGKREPPALFTYSPADRKWAKVAAPAPELDGRWGALGYDPVNNELVLCGGHGSRGKSVWLFDLKAKTWRRDSPADKEMIALYEEGGRLYWQATELVGRAANRFTIAETAEEAKEDLGARAAKLSSNLKALGETAKAAKVGANHAAAVKHAAGLLAALASDYAKLKGKLGGKITPGLLSELRGAKRGVLEASRALSPEPVARGLSPLALDPAGKRLVLFGGDRLDSVLSDTWVYDCETRKWSQRFPKKVPPARAGHILDWLPKAKKIVLAGGYSRSGALPQDIWTFDVDASEWRLLRLVPTTTVRRRNRQYTLSPGCPSPAYDQPLAGTVCPGDILVAQTPSRDSNTLHGCRVDASAVDTAGTEKHGVSPGTITFHPQEPASWEKVAAPDAAKSKAFLAGLKPNVWTEFKSPMPAPGARNRWGTVAYDPDRKQFLYWGGGHASSMNNEVSHFSLRGSCWTVSYPPDYPRERTTYMSWGGTTFSARPAMPWAHAYQAYSYSPDGRMCLLSATYDVRAREWMPRAQGLKHRGEMRSMVEYTPHGAVCLSEYGLFKFDAAKHSWSALPWNGPKFGGAWCDGHALCYDSKRDCLWVAHSSIFKYDFKTGKAENLSVKPPAALRRKGGKKDYALWREQVHLPDADLILIMRALPGPGGQPSQSVWDPKTGKYYWVDLPHSDGKSRGRSWSSAIAYDPELKLALICDSGKYVWVLKFDRKTAKLQEIK